MEWISVEDRLSETGDTVLACDKPFPDINFIRLYQYKRDNDNWYQYCSPGEKADNITHWMPLPDPPKEN